MKILIIEDEYSLANAEQNKCVIIVAHSQNVCNEVDTIYELVHKC